MKILFLTSVYKHSDKGNLNVDFIDSLALDGHELIVMTPKERKYKPKEQKQQYGNVSVLEFKCLNFRGKVNIIEKGVSTLLLGHQYKNKFKKYFKNERIDLVIYTTLPITYSPILRYLKKRYGTYCYLQQKDFFPQSAVDLDIMRKNSLSYKLFRKIEKRLFLCSDTIGVMSKGNVDYLLKNNEFVDTNKVEVCPNAIFPQTLKPLSVDEKSSIRKKYNIPTDAVVFIYGGNVSRAQGVDEIIKLFDFINGHPILNAYFLIVGSGNEFGRLKESVYRYTFVKFVNYLDKQDFDKLVSACDVGMVFLDPRFTIHNIPSRTLAHMNLAQPILAATDETTDYRFLIESNKIGLWSLNGDIQKTYSNIVELSTNEEKRRLFGQNSYNLLLRENDVNKVKQIVLKHLNMR